MNYTVLSPWAEVSSTQVCALNPRLDTLNGRTIGMFSHFKGHSPYILREVEKEAARQQLVQDILLEVNIGGEAAKSGFAPQEVENAAAQAKEMDHVRVRGLMTIPPADATREENVVYFQKVQALYVDINRKMYDNGLEYLSMGMSGDFADAIRAGANMVRVGTAIFGARDYSK